MGFSCPILHSSFWIIYLFVIVDILHKVIIYSRVNVSVTKLSAPIVLLDFVFA